jgi:hypothetical protein
MRKQNNNQNKKKKIQSLFICCQSNLKHYILINGNNGEFFVFLRKKTKCEIYGSKFPNAKYYPTYLSQIDNGRDKCEIANFTEVNKK